MFKNRKSLKTTVLSLTLSAGLLLPLTMNAQYREDQFGLQEWGQTSLMGRQGGGGDDGLSLQGFGENQNGLSLQNFGENVPLGSGWLVLMTAGLGYAAMKTRKNKKQTKPVK